MSETPDTESLAMAPGQILKRAREGKNLTVAAIATLMNLDLRTIEALERGELSKLPAPIFVRGYLRGYARLVDVAESTVLEAYQAQAPSEPMPRSVGMSRVPVRPAFRATSVSWKGVLTTLLVLVAVGLGVQWGPDLLARLRGDVPQETTDVVESTDAPIVDQTTPESTGNGSATALPPEMPVQSLTQAELTGTDAVMLNLPEAQPVPATEAPPPVAQPEPELPSDTDFAASTTDAVETTPAQPLSESGELRLELRISEDSWVEVRGADGKTLVLGLLRKGDTRSLAGKAPVSVVLGNAAGVELHVGGKLFEHSRYTRDNIARFDIKN